MARGPHATKASIRDLDVVTERRILLQERRVSADTHAETTPDGNYYNPYDTFVNIGERTISIAELTFLFKRGQRTKTRKGAHKA